MTNPVIIQAGSIITMDPNRSRAEAVLVEDGKIVEVGSAEDLKGRAPDAEVEDLGDDVLLPGFIDPHSHPIVSGSLTQDPVHWIAPYVGYPTFDDVVKKFQGVDADTPEGVPAIFNGLDRPPARALFNKKNIGEAQELSRTMQAYWVNFAKTGDPNGPGLPAWQRFEPDDQRLQVLDTRVYNQPHPEVERCDFWDGYSRPYIELINGLLKQLNP